MMAAAITTITVARMMTAMAAGDMAPDMVVRDGGPIWAAACAGRNRAARGVVTPRSAG